MLPINTPHAWEAYGSAGGRIGTRGVIVCSTQRAAPCIYRTDIQSVQLKVRQLLHIVAKLSRPAPPAVGIGGSDQLRSWGSFWVAKTVF